MWCIEYFHLMFFAFKLGTDQTRNSAKLLFLLSRHPQALLGFRTMATRRHTISECSIKGTNVMYVPVHPRSDHGTFSTHWKDAQLASVDSRAGSTHDDERKEASSIADLSGLLYYAISFYPWSKHLNIAYATIPSPFHSSLISFCFASH